MNTGTRMNDETKQTGAPMSARAAERLRIARGTLEAALEISEQFHPLTERPVTEREVTGYMMLNNALMHRAIEEIDAARASMAGAASQQKGGDR